MHIHSGYSYGAFYPIDELARQDATVTLLFIWTNYVSTYSPIDDPIYAAHQEQVPGRWGFDLPGGVLGCAEQVRIGSALPQRMNHTDQ